MIISIIARSLIVLYALGVLISMIAWFIHASKMQQRPNVSVAVDVVARSIAIFWMSLFWPVQVAIAIRKD